MGKLESKEAFDYICNVNICMLKECKSVPMDCSVFKILRSYQNESDCTVRFIKFCPIKMRSTWVCPIVRE